MLRLMSTRSCRHQFAVDHDAGSDIHRLAPLRHLFVGVVADVGVVERSPAAEKNAPAADLFVSGHGFVE